jgi:hypothetical protein
LEPKTLSSTRDVQANKLFIDLITATCVVYLNPETFIILILGCNSHLIGRYLLRPMKLEHQDKDDGDVEQEREAAAKTGAVCWLRIEETVNSLLVEV